MLTYKHKDLLKLRLIVEKTELVIKIFKQVGTQPHEKPTYGPTSFDPLMN